MKNGIAPKKVVETQKSVYTLTDIGKFIKDSHVANGERVKSATWNEKNTQFEVISEKDAEEKKPKKSKENNSSSSGNKEV